MDNNEKNIAIKMSGVKKRYKLGQIGGETLQADLQSWWAKVRGKEDPNSKIGTERSNGTVFMALNGIDLTIYRGEAIGIIGKNGAGKSTLLKLLSRVTAPTQGEIDIYGRITSMLEVGTGFNGELTGRENIYMNGAILGMTKAEIDEKMEEIIEFSEVREFIDTPVKRYSSGMYVKLGFSVAANLDSEIMIMDEVLAVGDMAFQKKCLDKMREAANKDGRTVLYVSHNMNTIRQLCSRCIVLDKGKIVFSGKVEEAIAIYMEHHNDCSTVYDFSKMERPNFATKTLQMSGLEILNKKDNRFSSGEYIDFVLHCKALKDAERVKLRFEICYADGSIVGTTFSDKAISEKAGNTFDLYMRFSTKNIPEGKYYAAALLYEYDEFGNQIVVDRVEPAISFEIESEDAELIWLHQWWGHIKFDDIVLKEKISADKNSSLTEQEKQKLV